MNPENFGLPPLTDEEASTLERLVRAGRSRAMSSETSKRIARRLAETGASSQMGWKGGAASRGLSRAVSGAKMGAILACLGMTVFGWHQVSRNAGDESANRPALEAGEAKASGVASMVPSVPMRVGAGAPSTTTPPTETSSVEIEALPSIGAASAGAAYPLATDPVRPTPRPPQRATAPAAVSVRPSPARSPSGAAPSSSAPEPSPVSAAPSPSDARALSGGAPSSAARPSEATTEEFALIRRAQAALASDPVRALAIADEHAHAFPDGEFVQERELTAIEALARLGRKTEARRRADEFLARFPRTPYAGRLERAR